MTYVSWAVFYEGTSDAEYFNTLLPRLMQDIVATKGTRNSTIPAAPAIMLGAKGRAIDDVVAEGCAALEAYHIVFIHADTGGTGLATTLASRSCAYCEGMEAECGLDRDRCIVIAPKHETEAWVLADPTAVTSVLGWSGRPEDIGLPRNAKEAEALVDPKSTLEDAIRQVRGARRVYPATSVFAPVSQRQSFAALRGSPSFMSFEQRLEQALQSLGCL